LLAVCRFTVWIEQLYLCCTLTLFWFSCEAFDERSARAPTCHWAVLRSATWGTLQVRSISTGLNFVMTEIINGHLTDCRWLAFSYTTDTWYRRFQYVNTAQCCESLEPKPTTVLSAVDKPVAGSVGLWLSSSLGCSRSSWPLSRVEFWVSRIITYMSNIITRPCTVDGWWRSVFLHLLSFLPVHMVGNIAIDHIGPEVVMWIQHWLFGMQLELGRQATDPGTVYCLLFCCSKLLKNTIICVILHKHRKMSYQTRHEDLICLMAPVDSLDMLYYTLLLVHLTSRHRMKWVIDVYVEG